MAKQLNDYQVNETIGIFVLIKSADVRVAKNGKQFISLVFQDKSGQVPGKFWDAKDEDINLFTSGEIVYLTGKVELYQGHNQVKIQSLKLATENDHLEASQFVTSAPASAEQMQNDLQNYVFDILNSDWNRIVRFLIKKYQTEFFDFPAAKSNHHAFRGGLAFHTLSILKLAKNVVDQYPNLDRSLLYAGAILHDLGKTIELSGPIGTEYTTEGNLIGHIVLIDEAIVEAAVSLKIDIHSEDMILLRHMILSHHGLLEYGSPERPKLIEAEVLHDLDELDASINMVSSIENQTKPGKFSERIFGLDNRRFYRPTEQLNASENKPK